MHIQSYKFTNIPLTFIFTPAHQHFLPFHTFWKAVRTVLSTSKARGNSASNLDTLTSGMAVPSLVINLAACSCGTMASEQTDAPILLQFMKMPTHQYFLSFIISFFLSFSLSLSLSLSPLFLSFLEKTRTLTLSRTHSYFHSHSLNLIHIHTNTIYKA